MKLTTNCKKTNTTGFTLVEILLALAIFSILTSVTIIAINPSKQLADSRDSEREAHVYSIVHALYQYSADEAGLFPPGLDATEKEICRTDAENCTGLYDLSDLTDNELYLTSMPMDPLCDEQEGVCTSAGTGYFLKLMDNGRIYLSASSSENKIITVLQ